ncbi:MAG: hypothetical protein ACK56I_25095 [bacterium]
MKHRDWPGRQTRSRPHLRAGTRRRRPGSRTGTKSVSDLPRPCSAHGSIRRAAGG